MSTRSQDGHPKPPLSEDQLQFVRRLRQDHTGAEAKLWLRLRARRLGGFKFRRQHPAGPYSLDFYCDEAKLAVELDGHQHSEAAGEAHDRARSAYLKTQGITVIRFWNHNVLRDTDAVCRTILRALQSPGSYEGTIGERSHPPEPADRKLGE